jgi:hypothetical protein
MPEPAKRPVGRPSKKFNQRHAEHILDCWSCSAFSLERVLEELRQKDARYPSLTTVWSWKRRYPEFAKAYAHARIDRADYMADGALDEALTTRKGIFRKSSLKSGVKTDELREDDNVARSRLIAEMKMRRASQLNPKEYRERMPDAHDEGPNEQLEALQRALLDGPVDTPEDDPGKAIEPAPDEKEPGS